MSSEDSNALSDCFESLRRPAQLVVLLLLNEERNDFLIVDRHAHRIITAKVLMMGVKSLSEGATLGIVKFFCLKLKLRVYSHKMKANCEKTLKDLSTTEHLRVNFKGDVSYAKLDMSTKLRMMMVIKTYGQETGFFDRSNDWKSMDQSKSREWDAKAAADPRVKLLRRFCNPVVDFAPFDDMFKDLKRSLDEKIPRPNAEPWHRCIMAIHPRENQTFVWVKS